MHYFILLFLWTLTTCFGDDTAAKLRIYDTVSQTGVVANKRWLNPDGTVQKVIYYHSKRDLSDGYIPKSESDLLPYEIKLFQYDNSYVTWIGVYRADFQLIRTAEVQYDREGIPVIETTRRSDGTLMRRTLHTEEPSTFKQYIYDENGLNETENRGMRVTDIDHLKIKS